MYADLLSDLTLGAVQLACKEDYLAGQDGWGDDRRFVADCPLLRAYLRLVPAARRDFSVMLKIGTWSDAFASHFLVVHPDQPVADDASDLLVLDPAMPRGAGDSGWTLAEADANLRDGRIGREWRGQGLEPGQIAGIWVFARWRNRTKGTLLGSLTESLAALGSGS